MTKRISRPRFDLFSIGTRLSYTHLVAEELSFWSDLDENVIGLVFRDQVDNDFGWSLMVRDRIGRFRGVDLGVSIPNVRQAEAQLRLRIAEVARTENLQEFGIQGDETNSATDLLTPLPGTVQGDLHPYFELLLNGQSRAPARAVLKELGPWLAMADPHFVREFQRYQFDQRLWELYLWAALREGGFDLTRLEAPDFKCWAPWAQFSLEATTVGPTMNGALAEHPNPETDDEFRAFLEGYMPIKFASALTGKLLRRSASAHAYWEEPEAKGLPFVIAVADFHKPADRDQLGSMTYSGGAIAPYLYGLKFNDDHTATPVEAHTYNGKSVPSGFFSLPEADNVSAVLFSNAGTIAKFDRMGVAAGYAPPDHRYFRRGVILDRTESDVELQAFGVEVSSEGYSETWADEVQIFHNPTAKIPLNPDAFAGLTQHMLVDGSLKTDLPRPLVVSSLTAILHTVRGDAEG